MNFDISIFWEKLQGMVNGFIAILPNILIAVILLFIFYWLARFLKYIVKRILKYTRPNIQIVVSRLIYWLSLFVSVLIVLTIIVPTLKFSDFLAFLGVGGIAIGFAFRDIIQNFLAGILLLLTEPFRVGDQIIVENYEGKVTQIQTRATFIRMYDGRRVVIPNASLFTKLVTINTAFPERRSQYDIGIGCGDDVEKARRLIIEAIRTVDSVLKKPLADAIIVSYGDYSINIRARWWTESTRKDVLDIKDQVLTAINNKLAENGIDLPYPTQVTLFHDQTEETDGDRNLQREGWPSDSETVVPKPLTIAGSIKKLTDTIAQKGKLK